jgi:hypothetical protein
VERRAAVDRKASNVAMMPSEGRGEAGAPSGSVINLLSWQPGQRVTQKSKQSRRLPPRSQAQPQPPMKHLSTCTTPTQLPQHLNSWASSTSLSANASLWAR